MQTGDTRKFISLLYVLTLLFLGAIYFQGEMIHHPEALSTLQQVKSSPVGSHSIQIMSSFQMSGETAMITIVSLTLFFGLAWFISHSKSY
jgi:hypothetical protein